MATTLTIAYTTPAGNVKFMTLESAKLLAFMRRVTSQGCKVNNVF
jgi:hypothetical protein